jgi:hypothetical protein
MLKLDIVRGSVEHMYGGMDWVCHRCDMSVLAGDIVVCAAELPKMKSCPAVAAATPTMKY